MQHTLNWELLSFQIDKELIYRGFADFCMGYIGYFLAKCFGGIIIDSLLTCSVFSQSPEGGLLSPFFQTLLSFGQ